MTYRCNMCEGEPFRVPADRIGAALMEEHLYQEHGVGKRPEPIIVRYEGEEDCG